jgi:hypothetical protein
MVHILMKRYPGLFSSNILINKFDKWSDPDNACYGDGRDVAFALKFKKNKYEKQRLWLVFKGGTAFLSVNPDAVWWYSDVESEYQHLKMKVSLEETLDPEYKDKTIQKFVTHNMDFFV